MEVMIEENGSFQTGALCRYAKAKQEWLCHSHATRLSPFVAQGRHVYETCFLIRLCGMWSILSRSVVVDTSPRSSPDLVTCDRGSDWLIRRVRVSTTPVDWRE